MLQASIPTPHHRTESILFDSGSQILQQEVERLDAKSVLVEEEVARAAALEEVAGACKALIKALQEKASRQHSVSVVAS